MNVVKNENINRLRAVFLWAEYELHTGHTAA